MQSQVVTVITVEIKDLNNDVLGGYNSLVTLQTQSPIVKGGHIWSQVVTWVGVKVKDLNNYGFGGYYGSKAPNQELVKREQE